MRYVRDEEGGRLVVVCGLPGSGKTALAKRLEVEYNAIRFCADEWIHALGADLFDERLRQSVEQLQWRVTQRLLQLGQAVVIEWGTSGRGNATHFGKVPGLWVRPWSGGSSRNRSTCCGNGSEPGASRATVGCPGATLRTTRRGFIVQTPRSSPFTTHRSSTRAFKRLWPP